MPKNIKRELANKKALRKCAQQFSLVGDTTRMKICWLLCNHNELAVSEIANILNVSVSVVSHSLKKLRQAEMVKTRHEHKQVFYTLVNNDFNKFLKHSLSQI
ncbi:winged helix-turn-helix transcriptional regulator [Patescibacteria group bacterium]|nr:winged helix-turn-helix transcriptional regulator [Patescibacteria group bacterium]